jgi:hypothetical protein
VSAATSLAVATNIFTRLDLQSTIEQASELLMKSNDVEEITIETEFRFINVLGCVEHVFRKKPTTKFRGDNAWVVEYLLDRFATQACRDLCDKVHTRLPQEVMDMICSYLYKPLTMEVALCFFHDKKGLCLVEKRQLPWIQQYDTSPYLQLCKELCRSSAAAFRADAFPGRWKSDRIPSDFVTRIQTSIDCDQFCTDVPGWETSKSQLLFHLEFLLGFPPGTIVELILHPRFEWKIWWDLDCDRVISMIFRVVLPTLDRYRTSGYVTRVVIKGFGRDVEVDRYLSLSEWREELAPVRVIQAPRRLVC